MCVQRPPLPKSTSKLGGYPPWRGILWVDLLWKLPHGRVCFVDEHQLINCKR